jgi:hypothetical protein
MRMMPVFPCNVSPSLSPGRVATLTAEPDELADGTQQAVTCKHPCDAVLNRAKRGLGGWPPRFTETGREGMKSSAQSG